MNEVYNKIITERRNDIFNEKYYNNDIMNLNFEGMITTGLPIMYDKLKKEFLLYKLFRTKINTYIRLYKGNIINNDLFSISLHNIDTLINVTEDSLKNDEDQYGFRFIYVGKIDDIYEKYYDTDLKELLALYNKKRLMKNKGKIVQHFKGDKYFINNFVHHTETDELMMYYTALYCECLSYVRPLDMASSITTKEYYDKYHKLFRFTPITIKSVKNAL